jgi:ABC-2 type transport system permease protein
MPDPADQPATFSTSRRLGIGLHVVLSCVALLAIVLMVNFLSARHFHRANWSADNRLELAPLTRQILAGLTNDVEVIVYFDKGDAVVGDRPSNRAIYEAVTGLLNEYRQHSRHVHVQLIDYYRNPSAATRFKSRYQLSPSADRDLILFDCQGRTRVVFASELSDYDISKLLAGQSREVKRTAFKGELLFSSAISQVATDVRPRAYFLQDHQEFDPTNQQDDTGFGKFAQLLQLNNVESQFLSLSGTNVVPADCDLLIVAGPRSRLSLRELEKLDAYLSQGGRLFAMLQPFGGTREVGLESLLAQWGVAVGNDLVRDPARSISGNGIVVTNYGVHDITRSLAQPVLPLWLILPRSVGRRADIPLQSGAPEVTELLLTTADGVAHGDFRDGVPYENPARDRRGALPLAVAVEKGALPGVKIERGSTRIVAVGDVHFLDNQLIDQLGNRHFAEKSVNWLLDRSYLLGGIGPVPVKEYKIVLTEGQMLGVRWVLLGVMPGAVLGLGVLVWLRRRH